MNGGDMEENGSGVIPGTTSHSPGTTEKNHEKSFTMADVPGEIRIGHLLDTCEGSHRLSHPLRYDHANDDNDDDNSTLRNYKN
jgi:hypothetical protein